MIDPMIDTLIQYALLALGLAASLGLFLTLKREGHVAAHKHGRRIKELEARVEAAETRQADAPPDSIPAHAPGASFNFHRRTQALRLLRRGEDVGHVAAALGVPRAAIELLVRIQEINPVRAA